MSEAKKTAALLKAWRLKYPDGLAWKINDRVARSRPDAMFIRNNNTRYVEFKMAGNDVTPGQAFELRKIASTGAGAYIAYFNKDGSISLSMVFALGSRANYDPMSQADFLTFLA